MHDPHITSIKLICHITRFPRPQSAWGRRIIIVEVPHNEESYAYRPVPDCGLCLFRL